MSGIRNSNGDKWTQILGSLNSNQLKTSTVYCNKTIFIYRQTKHFGHGHISGKDIVFNALKLYEFSKIGAIHFLRFVAFCITYSKAYMQYIFPVDYIPGLNNCICMQSLKINMANKNTDYKTAAKYICIYS